jgi:hypothetical protein
MKKRSKNKINDGHYLELMDRLYIQTCMIEDHLLNHPLTKKLKKVKKLVDISGMALAEAYQLVGEKSFKNDEKKNPISKIVLRRRKNSTD